MTARTSKIYAYIEKTLNTVTVALFIFICVSILAQVTARKFGGTIIWVNETSRWSFVLLVFFGTVLVTKNKHHLYVSVLLDVLKPKYRLFATLPARLIVIAVSVMLVYSFALLTKSTIGMSLNTVPFISVGYVYALSGTAFFAVALVELWHVWDEVIGYLRGSAGEPPRHSE